MKDLFDFLAENKVTPNGWLVLWATHTKTMYVNYINFHTEQTRLVLSGHLVEDRTLMGKAYPLSDEGKHLIRQVETTILRTKRMTKQKNEVPYEDWAEILQEYSNLFPAARPHGKALRTEPKQLYDRFVWFFAEYPQFNWEIVFEATKAYVESKEADPGGLMYIRTAGYFVKKQENAVGRSIISDLADWCSAVKDGSIEEMRGGGKRYFESDVV